VDASHEMIRLARKSFPDEDWRMQDMRSLQLTEKFAGIIGWNSFFHLTKNEQRTLLPNLADKLVPGGALLLTVGPREGEVIGRVGEDAVYHASLSPQEDEKVIRQNTLTLIEFTPEDPDCYGMSLLLAKKNG